MWKILCKLFLHYIDTVIFALGYFILPDPDILYCLTLYDYVNTVGQQTAVNANRTGTKCAAVHCFTLQPRCHAVFRCRLYHVSCAVGAAFDKHFDSIFSSRRRECHEFYSQVSHSFAHELVLLVDADWCTGQQFMFR